jgi:hypothetical protein
VKLYVCHGTFKVAPRPGGHPCGNAYHALKDAGHDPEVEKVRGLGILPDFLNPGRKKVKQLTGDIWVPVLELDDGTVIKDSKKIVEWAKAHPAGAAAA